MPESKNNRMRKYFDKIFLEFPLIYLNYVGDDLNKLNELLQMQIVEAALKSTINVTMDFGKIKTNDFEIENPVHKKIVVTAKRFNINLGSIEDAIQYWIDLKTLLYAYEDKYGKDAYCRMGKKLTEDVLNGTFGFREYKVLAAIHSILGKQKSFLRITYEQISYRALGYKRKKIAFTEGVYQGALSAHQVKRSVTKLTEKKLLTCVTYLYREKYYSTKIKQTSVLRDLVAKKKKEASLIRSSIRDVEWSRKTQQEIKYNLSTKL